MMNFVCLKYTTGVFHHLYAPVFLKIKTLTICLFLYFFGGAYSSIVY